MGNSWINIRIGVRHFMVCHSPFSVSFGVNTYHLYNKPEKFIEVYDFFGLV